MVSNVSHSLTSSLRALPEADREAYLCALMVHPDLRHLCLKKFTANVLPPSKDAVTRAARAVLQKIDTESLVQEVARRTRELWQQTARTSQALQLLMDPAPGVAAALSPLLQEGVDLSSQHLWRLVLKAPAAERQALISTLVGHQILPDEVNLGYMLTHWDPSYKQHFQTLSKSQVLKVQRYITGEDRERLLKLGATEISSSQEQRALTVVDLLNRPQASGLTPLISLFLNGAVLKTSDLDLVRKNRGLETSPLVCFLLCCGLTAENDELTRYIEEVQIAYVDVSFKEVAREYQERSPGLLELVLFAGHVPTLELLRLFFEERETFFEMIKKPPLLGNGPSPELLRYAFFHMPAKFMDLLAEQYHPELFPFSGQQPEGAWETGNPLTWMIDAPTADSLKQLEGWLDAGYPMDHELKERALKAVGPYAVLQLKLLQQNGL